jgi:hypothetical protein
MRLQTAGWLRIRVNIAVTEPDTTQNHEFMVSKLRTVINGSITLYVHIEFR